MTNKKTIIEINSEVDMDVSLIEKLRGELEKAISILDRSGSELSIQIVSDQTIQKLHLQYMDDDTPTDVLSFEQDIPSPGSFGLLGDIIVSKDTATRQSQEKKWTLHEEMLYLAIHGLLHLLGYDHANPEEEKIMFGIQNELFHQVFTS